jgi:hypothetical protein
MSEQGFVGSHWVQSTWEWDSLCVTLITQTTPFPSIRNPFWELRLSGRSSNFIASLRTATQGCRTLATEMKSFLKRLVIEDSGQDLIEYRKDGASGRAKD